MFSYEYDNSGNVGYQKDWINNKQYWYEYDSLLRLGKVTTKDASGTVNWSKNTYDNRNNLVSFAENLFSTNYLTTYTYDSDDRLKTSSFGTSSIDFGYDASLGRLTNYAYKVNGTTIFNTSFAYAPGDGVASTASERISSITNGSQILTYTYNDMGYTTSISNGSDSSQYRYDAIGELVRENYNWDGISFTMLYNYDEGGNLTSKVKYAYVAEDGIVSSPSETFNYEYGDTNWKDKLTNYNGNSITYDEIGNPLNDGKWTYKWTQGRQLELITDGTTTISYKYNDQGIRTEKAVNGVTTKYSVSGGLVTWEKTGSKAPIYYLYDSNGKLWGLNWNANTYFYVCNSQGDVIGIVDKNGAIVVSYSYDAWGKLLNVSGSQADTLGQDNPYRYRGYRYDGETGLYYLENRYYNPEWCRFINEDAFFSTGLGLLASNMFVYCLNNPVTFEDNTGCRPDVAADWQHETPEERRYSLSLMAPIKPPINPSNYDDPDAQDRIYDYNQSKDQKGTPSEKQKKDKRQIKQKFGDREKREEETERLHDDKKDVRNDDDRDWKGLDAYKSLLSGVGNMINTAATHLIVAFAESFFKQASPQQPGLHLPGIQLPNTGD